MTHCTGDNYRTTLRGNSWCGALSYRRSADACHAYSSRCGSRYTDRGLREKSFLSNRSAARRPTPMHNLIFHNSYSLSFDLLPIKTEGSTSCSERRVASASAGAPKCARGKAVGLSTGFFFFRTLFGRSVGPCMEKPRTGETEASPVPLRKPVTAGKTVTTISTHYRIGCS